MLQLRPSCEHCNKALPANATDARICSFECTFCAHCVDEILANVCPNCGGGFAPRPIRPAHDLKNGNYLGQYPARTEVVFKPVDLSAHAQLMGTVAATAPEQR